MTGVCGKAVRRTLRYNPELRLTLDAAATSDPAVFGQTDYFRSVRQTSGRVRRDIYRAYGVDRRSGRIEIDHPVPLGLSWSATPRPVPARPAQRQPAAPARE
jgi:hypothetical protein